VSDRPAAFGGWAFLVARGRRKGYQSLLVPDFLAESNEYGVLGQTASGDFPAVGAPRISRVSGLVAGDVTLAYQTQRLTYADLDSPDSLGGRRPDEPLTDEFGRPLDLLYGFVCRAAGISEVDDADFLAARAEALRTYQRFLADESGFELEKSRPFVLRSVPAPSPPEPSPAPVPLGDATPSPLPRTEPASMGVAAHLPQTRRRSRWNAVLVALLALAISTAVWTLVLRGNDGPVTKVTVDEPQSDTVDCTSPVLFRATVETNAKATVTYHWESNVGGNSAQAELVFAKPAEQSIEKTLQLTGSSGDEIKVTLVIDSPNNKQAARNHLTCK
jgi:hypothetical protein